jgi:hypothetical protein
LKAFDRRLWDRCWRDVGDASLNASLLYFVEAGDMADSIEIDLATLKRILHEGLDLGFSSLQGCTVEISIGSEVLAALLAGDLGRVDSIVGP